MMTDFEKFRKQYPVFRYSGYTVSRDEAYIHISFDMSVDSLCSFRPEIKIDISNLTLVNDYDSPAAREIVFSLGLVECVSYLKATCSPVMKVECGSMSAEDRQWWKKLYLNGLGEFLYKNNIDISPEDFISIEAPDRQNEEEKPPFVSSGINIIPVGGGKDSAVTAELMKNEKEHNMFFTVNDQQAREDTVAAAGYDRSRIIRTYRKISPELLDLNRRGFLNGHTPFSAIVAFLSTYCAYITGAENIILSNEASANEANIGGLSVNHQYSKSYEFESDFNAYAEKHFGISTKYFSLLRPFSELQIAAYFSSLGQYHRCFRSCNAGSKKNIWCAACAKCLFVFCILSPFLSEQELEDIFGENLFEKQSLLSDFQGLTGLTPVKPFECVGTTYEVRFALAMTAKKYSEQGKKLPALLSYFVSRADTGAILSEPSPLEYFNSENSIPEKYIPCVKEMYSRVSHL